MSKGKELWKAAGGRLAEARLQAGFSSQRVFADAVELAEPTIAKYEQGAREIPMWLLVWLGEHHGINSGWIVSGRGEMLDDPSKAPAPSTKVDAWAMGRAYSVIEKVCKDIGRPVTGSQLAEEAAELYSALLGRVVDVRERPMVETALGILAEEAKERMIGRKPGSGKRSASSW
ncbi:MULTISPECIES: helix-turn-helix domain-containing protein [unclassified Shinella]|uniref:helix-turn-helix domain-containing protein n=1 Tax=unclassified Shinella TaxID=2643062 RepID=UPI0012E19345|nr:MULTISPECIES: helix-turn-helix transcriptional regulator [unclassified Shinella]